MKCRGAIGRLVEAMSRIAESTRRLKAKVQFHMAYMTGTALIAIPVMLAAFRDRERSSRDRPRGPSLRRQPCKLRRVPAMADLTTPSP